MDYKEFRAHRALGTLTLDIVKEMICDKDNNDEILEYFSKDDNFKNTIEDIIKNQKN